MSRDDRSKIFGLVAAGGVLGGIAVAGKNSYSTLSSNLGRFTARDVGAQVAELSRQLSRFDTRPKVVSNITNISDTVSHALGVLDNAMGSLPINARDHIAKTTYESLLSGGRISAAEAHVIYKEVLAQQRIDDSYRMAQKYIREYSGNANIFNKAIPEGSIKGIGSLLSEKYKFTTKSPGFTNPQKTLNRLDLTDDLLQKLELNPLEIQKRLGTLAAGSGKRLSWQGIYEQQELPILRGKLEGQRIDIPLMNKGYTFSGENLTTRYTTRKFGLPGEETMSFGKKYYQDLQDMLTSSNSTITDINRKLFGSIIQDEQASAKMAIYSMPKKAMSAGSRFVDMLRQHEVLIEEGGNLETIESLTKEWAKTGEGLNPFTSPNSLAKGVFTEKNIPEFFYGDLGMFYTAKNRPTQSFRSEYEISSEVLQQAKERKLFGNFSRTTESLMGKEFQEAIEQTGYKAVGFETFFVKPTAEGNLPEKVSRFMSNENLIFSEDVQDLLKVERALEPKLIDIREGSIIHKDIASLLETSKIGELVAVPEDMSKTIESFSGIGAEPRPIGIEYGTGKEVILDAPDLDKVKLSYLRKVDENKAEVFLRGTLNPTSETSEYAKYFMEEGRLVGKVSNQTQFKEILQAAGATQNVEAIATAKELSRKSGTLFKQQTYALTKALSEKYTEGTAPKEVLKFFENPWEVLKASNVKELVSKSMADAEFAMQSSIYNMAERHGILQDKAQVQNIFGMMNVGTAEKLGGSEFAKLVSESTGVYGVSFPRVGGTVLSQGAGKIATMEASAMRAIAMQGDEGIRAAAEIAGRIEGKGFGKAALLAMETATGTLTAPGLLDKIIGNVGVSERTLAQMGAEDIVKDVGQYVNLGTRVGGIKSLYIPGLAEAPFMASSVSKKTGEVIQSPVTSALTKLSSSIRRLEATPDDSALKAAAETAMNEYQNIISREAISQITPKGKVTGSLYEMAVQRTADRSAKMGIGLSGQDIRNMYGQLIESATDEKVKEQLGTELSDILAGKKTGYGVVYREPVIGPLSTQFQEFYKDDLLKEGQISIPQRTGTINLPSGQQAIDLSPATGMKLDYDMDHLNIVAITNKDTQARLAKKVSVQAESDYTEFLFKHYSYKSLLEKKKGEALADNFISAQVAGAEDLVSAKLSTGQVNIAMNKLKLGVLYNRPDEWQDLGNLMYWLEEGVISRKRGDIGFGSEELYEKISKSVSKKDTKGLAGVLRESFGEAASWKGSIETPSGIVEKTFDFDPDIIANKLMGGAENITDEIENVFKASRIAAGKETNLSARELANFASRFRSGSIDPGVSALQALSLGPEKIAGKADRALRRSSSISKSMLKALKENKKPLLIGGAIAAAAMILSPSIGGSLPTSEGPRGGRGFFPEELGIPFGAKAYIPPARIMASPKSYNMSGIQGASRANIRLSSNDYNGENNDLMVNARSLASQGNNVSIRTYDDRNALTPARLANDIFDRL